MSRPLTGALVFLASSALFAQADSVIPNWTVPPWTSSSGGLTTMTDFTPPRVFVAVAPCRIVDTRNAAGPYGGPALLANIARPFDLDNGPCPGLPTGIEAYSLNFGGILPPADGFLTAWPTGSSQPLVSQLNLVGGEVVANAAIVPAGTNGAINVLVNIGPTHVYIDINGYFSDVLGTPGNSLEIRNSSSSATLLVVNGSSSCGGPCGVQAQTVSGNAVSGLTTGSGVNYGVYGQANSQTDGTAGVRALANSTSGVTFGVYGTTNSSATDAAGVRGEASHQSGETFGVRGQTNSDVAGSAGILGIGNVRPTIVGDPTHVGVRGESGTGNGVVGLSHNIGVTGTAFTPAGAIFAQGRLGMNSGGAAGDYGVFAFGNYGGNGAKYFVEPHPTDPSRVIRYIALEGPEPGTYFRGRGKVERGIARIPVPEDFRMVTDAEGLTVQITPLGTMATSAVLKADLNEIVIQASRSVEFYYLVQGVRRTHKHLVSPVGEGREFMPDSADAVMAEYLTEGQKRLLVENGTYRPDGTVNMETARRLGWDRLWAEREGRPTLEPAPE
jgi:hypothetical protein